MRWNPNKAKSNSIHWLCQRVEPTKCFRNYSADCIVSQSRGWERLLVLLTRAARSASLPCPRHYNINSPATGQRRVLVSHNSAGNGPPKLQNKGKVSSEAPDNERANCLASALKSKCEWVFCVIKRSEKPCWVMS